MEALRTQLDNLKWEVNRLDAENRRLHDGNPEATARVDLEDELEKSKAELAWMAGQARESEERLDDHVRTATEAERRAMEAESEAGRQEKALSESQTQLQETVEELRRAEAKTAELQNELAEREARLEELNGELESKDEELQGRYETYVRQKKTMELERYRRMESATERWEAREQ